jgi:hypothetical protein
LIGYFFGVCDSLGDMEIVCRALESSAFATVDGYVMTDLLKEHGATEDDLQAFPKLWSQTMGDDPSYKFRKSTQTRWQFDKEFSTATRLDKAPFKLEYGNNAVLKDQVREFAEGSEDFVTSSVHHAIVKVMGDLLYRTCNDVEKDELGFISGFHQFRITFDPEPDETPEGTTANCPTPEGIHQDGAQLVLIMFINSDNMAPRSGESRIYRKEQEGGVLTRIASREAREKTRLAERNLVTPFETLILCDRDVKHDNRPIVAADKTRTAFRDVVVFWTRPFNDADRDVTRKHPELPLNVQLPQGWNTPMTLCPGTPEDVAVQLDTPAHMMARAEIEEMTPGGYPDEKRA